MTVVFLLRYIIKLCLLTTNSGFKQRLQWNSQYLPSQVNGCSMQNQHGCMPLLCTYALICWSFFFWHPGEFLGTEFQWGKWWQHWFLTTCPCLYLFIYSPSCMSLKESTRGSQINDNVLNFCIIYSLYCFVEICSQWTHEWQNCLASSDTVLSFV